eukprot:3343363-Lingulodinium_polyedra.AAC.1
MQLDKASGFSQWLADVHAQLRSKAGEDVQAPTSPEFQRLVCTRAAAVWAGLAVHEQNRLLAKARCSVAMKKER